MSICTLTARRLKAGACEDLRAAWDPGDAPEELVKRWSPVYHCRDVNDENVVVSFGFFQGSLDELRSVQDEFGRDDQVSAVDPHVEEVLFDGAFEVVEELTP